MTLSCSACGQIKDAEKDYYYYRGRLSGSICKECRREAVAFPRKYLKLLEQAAQDDADLRRTLEEKGLWPPRLALVRPKKKMRPPKPQPPTPPPPRKPTPTTLKLPTLKIKPRPGALVTLPEKKRTVQKPDLEEIFNHFGRKK